VPGVESSFWDENGAEISAAITLAVTVALALVVDRLVLARAKHVADRFALVGRREAAPRGQGPLAAAEPRPTSGVSRATQTRLQVVRRLVFVIILAIGIALALSQFGSIRRLATGILASSALLGLVIGFAARQTIANFVAGILVAITQPIRIGDRVTFDEETGRVDDVTLTFTYIDTGDGRLMVVPNEQIVTGVLFNHSTGDQAAPVTASVWLPPDADLAAARRAVESAGAATVSVAELTVDGVRLEVSTAREAGRTRTGGEEAALRERAQRALREADLLQENPPG
jgi:small-conductance mechanosensitive channel